MSFFCLNHGRSIRGKKGGRERFRETAYGCLAWIENSIPGFLVYVSADRGVKEQGLVQRKKWVPGLLCESWESHAACLEYGFLIDGRIIFILLQRGKVGRNGESGNEVITTFHDR